MWFHYATPNLYPPEFNYPGCPFPLGCLLLMFQLPVLFIEITPVNAERIASHQLSVGRSSAGYEGGIKEKSHFTKSETDSITAGLS